MNPLLKKMNFKAESPIAILHAPEEFQAEMEAMREFTEVHTTLKKDHRYDFYLVFVKSQEELERAGKEMDGHTAEDGLLWVAYPKKSSKKYKSDINRDSEAWQVLGKMGYEGVRQVAIDADWSALRFRDVKFIKNMSRSFAMTEEGKAKSQKD